MKHLVLTVKSDLVEYRMGNRTGSQPLGKDDAEWIIAYLIKIINPTTYEII